MIQNNKTIENIYIPADKKTTAGKYFFFNWWNPIVTKKIDFHDIFTGYKDKIFNFIFRATGNYHLTEDIFQDVFLKAYKNLENFKGKSSISTWLFSIAINSIRDERRRKSFQLLMKEDDINIKSKIKSPEEEVIEKESRTLVQKELNRLNNSLKIPLLLYYFEDMSIKEISKITGKTEKNIKVILHRAKKILSKRLKRAGYEI